MQRLWPQILTRHKREVRMMPKMNIHGRLLLPITKGDL